MKLNRDKNGEWRYKKIPKRNNPIIIENLLKYLNSIDKLFENAKAASEFEFIFTLLRVKGVVGPGWDSYENTEEIFNLLSKLMDKSKEYKTNSHLGLLLYGLIVESSEIYEIYANLLKICAGDRFNINNFPDKKRKKYSLPQSPSEKIGEIKELAKKVNLENSVLPIIDIYDRELRNSIFHSDYCIFNDELRIPSSKRKYFNDDLATLLNKSYAYFMALSNLIKFHIQSYDSPKVIKVHPEFSKDPDETAITIIRKGYGLVGLKDNWQQNEIALGKIPYRIGRFSKSETNLLDKNRFQTILPRSKREIVNKYLKIFPLSVRKIIVRNLKDKFD